MSWATSHGPTSAGPSTDSVGTTSRRGGPTAATTGSAASDMLPAERTGANTATVSPAVTVAPSPSATVRRAPTKRHSAPAPSPVAGVTAAAQSGSGSQKMS